MKKNILFVLMLMIFPMTVYADGVSLNCPSEIIEGNEFSCTLNGNSNEMVTSISAQVKYSDNLSLVSFSPDSKWQGDGLNGNIKLYTSNDIKNNFVIGVLKFKSSGKENSQIVIDTINFYDENDKGITIESISKEIKIKVINNNTGSNSNSGNNSSSNSSTNNSGTSNNSSSSNSSSNNNIIVDDNSDKDNNNSNDNQDNLVEEDNTLLNSTYLVDIQIDNYQIDFSKEIEEYELKIGNEKSLNIIPLLEDNSATYQISGNNDLVNGSVIEIRVISSDDSSRIYKIKIIKDDEEKNSYTGIFIGIIIILVGINIVRLVLNRRKNNEEE